MLNMGGSGMDICWMTVRRITVRRSAGSGPKWYRLLRSASWIKRFMVLTCSELPLKGLRGPHDGLAPVSRRVSTI